MSRNSLCYYKELVKQFTCKKAIKNLSCLLEYKTVQEEPLEKYTLIQALFEGVDWKIFIKNPGNSEDIVKIGYLSKKLKIYSQHDNFVDYFGLTLYKCHNRSFISQNLFKILKTLKLSLIQEIILMISVAFQEEDEDLRQSGFENLRILMREFSENVNTQEMKRSFVIFWVQFIKDNS